MKVKAKITDYFTTINKEKNTTITINTGPTGNAECLSTNQTPFFRE